jgi:hypothetical protein
MTTTYNIGDLVNVNGTTWRVNSLSTGKGRRSRVGLVNPANPNQSTSFYADVLDKLGTIVPSDNERQYRDLANAIAQQAEALALGKIPTGQRYAQARRLLDNTQTLMTWTTDDRRA